MNLIKPKNDNESKNKTKTEKEKENGKQNGKTGKTHARENQKKKLLQKNC